MLGIWHVLIRFYLPTLPFHHRHTLDMVPYPLIGFIKVDKHIYKRMLMRQYIKGAWISPSFTYFNWAFIVVVQSGWKEKDAVEMQFA